MISGQRCQWRTRRGSVTNCWFGEECCGFELQIPETFVLGGCALHGGVLRHEQISSFVKYIVVVELGCANMLLLSIDEVESARRHINLSL